MYHYINRIWKDNNVGTLIKVMVLAVFTINVMLEITANHSVNNMLIEAIHFTQSFRFCFCFFTVKAQRNCGLLYPYIYSTLSFKNEFYI